MRIIGPRYGILQTEREQQPLEPMLNEERVHAGIRHALTDVNERLEGNPVGALNDRPSARQGGVECDDLRRQLGMTGIYSTRAPAGSIDSRPRRDARASLSHDDPDTEHSSSMHGMLAVARACQR